MGEKAAYLPWRLVELELQFATTKPYRRTDCGAIVVVVVVVAVEEEENAVVVVEEVVVLIWSAQNDHKIIPAHH